MDLMPILKEFMLTPAPSGYEKEMAYRMKEYFMRYCDEVTIDVIGNCIGKITGTQQGLPDVMVFGHMDSLGMIVRRIESDGYIQVDRLGGIPEKVLPGINLLIRSEDCSWHPGIIGTKAHHATPQEEKYKVDLITSLFVDMGARSSEEVRDLGIDIGCPVVYKPQFTKLLGSRITGTAVDNRGACACLVGMSEYLSKNRPKANIYLVGTVWEEFNLRGAMMAARTIKPGIAISLDVALASDTHDLKDRYQDTLGGGSCVFLYSFHGRGTLNGTLAHEPLFRLAKHTSQELQMPLQRFAGLGILTDAAYIQLEGEGIATLEMGFPVRYTHTPVELCDVKDIEQLSILTSEILIRVDETLMINRY